MPGIVPVVLEYQATPSRKSCVLEYQVQYDAVCIYYSMEYNVLVAEQRS